MSLREGGRVKVMLVERDWSENGEGVEICRIYIGE